MNIPEHHQQFCRDVAKLARKYGLNRFSGTFHPSFKDEWHNEISFSWEQGRHGADKERVVINSKCFVRTTLETTKPISSSILHDDVDYDLIPDEWRRVS